MSPYKTTGFKGPCLNKALIPREQFSWTRHSMKNSDKKRCLGGTAGHVSNSWFHLWVALGGWAPIQAPHSAGSLLESLPAPTNQSIWSSDERAHEEMGKVSRKRYLNWVLKDENRVLHGWERFLKQGPSKPCQGTMTNQSTLVETGNKLLLSSSKLGGLCWVLYTFSSNLQ